MAHAPVSWEDLDEDCWLHVLTTLSQWGGSLSQLMGCLRVSKTIHMLQPRITALRIVGNPFMIMYPFMHHAVPTATETFMAGAFWHGRFRGLQRLALANLSSNGWQRAARTVLAWPLLKHLELHIGILGCAGDCAVSLPNVSSWIGCRYIDRDSMHVDAMHFVGDWVTGAGVHCWLHTAQYGHLLPPERRLQGHYPLPLLEFFHIGTGIPSDKQTLGGCLSMHDTHLLQAEGVRESHHHDLVRATTELYDLMRRTLTPTARMWMLASERLTVLLPYMNKWEALFSAMPTASTDPCLTDPIAWQGLWGEEQVVLPDYVPDVRSEVDGHGILWWIWHWHRCCIPTVDHYKMMGSGGFGAGGCFDICLTSACQQRNPSIVLDKMDCIVRNVRGLIQFLISKGAHPCSAWDEGSGRLPNEEEMAYGRQHQYDYSSTTEDEDA